MNIFEIIKNPIVTEKTTKLIQEQNKYTFSVDVRATKTQIKEAFTKLFGIEPIAINMIKSKAQDVRSGTKFPGRSPNVKKAIVTLSKDQHLNIMGEDVTEDAKKSTLVNEVAKEIKEEKAESSKKAE